MGNSDLHNSPDAFLFCRSSITTPVRLVDAHSGHRVERCPPTFAIVPCLERTAVSHEVAVRRLTSSRSDSTRHGKVTAAK
jgi:hypothetical protein